MSRGEKPSGIRISYSSSTTFQGCQRRFYYQKVVKIDHDPDFEDNAKALRIGKAFHAILEYCEHDQAKLKPGHFMKSFEENAVSSPTEQGLIAGMVRKYIGLHRDSKLKVAGIEIQVGDGVNYIGFVDVLLVDENGNWWIVDLKTAARLSASLLSRLSRDPQLNIYAYFMKDIAKELNLDPEKFMGVRYRVTTKATIKCGPKETIQAFSKRCFDRIESYDIGIPKQDLIPEKVHTKFMSMLKDMRALEDKKEDEVSQNFGECEKFFKPCPYWSNCYGKTFTANAEQYEIFDSDNIEDLTVASIEGDDSDLDFL